MKATLTDLMTSRRFAPFFFTQFLGAFNDNVFRQGLILVIASGAVTATSANTLNNIGLALFILPFFLFSALAGQIADKYEKSMLLRRIKFAEVLIMLAGAAGFLFDAVYFLLAILFCMGLQSAFFGPIKYSIIPQHLSDRELVAGNALVEMGTFMAILLGSVAGVVLKMEGMEQWLAPLAVVSLALLGFLFARAIPAAVPAHPDLRLDWHLLRETGRILGYAREVRSVWVCVLGISWFWFLGAAYTTQLKAYVDDYLYGTEGLYALLLATFSVGIGAGSFLCEKLSGRRVELAMVPVGALGLTLFGVDMFFSYHNLTILGPMDSGDFVTLSGGLRVMADLFGIGVFGGFYIVPLFAYIQHRSNPRFLSRIIAANNILNALLMVLSAVAGIVLVGMLEWSIPRFFLALAVANLLVAAYLCRLMPLFLARLSIWLVTRLRYSVKTVANDSLPDTGPVLLVCSCWRETDALLLAGTVRRPVRFVMPRPMYEKTSFRWALAPTGVHVVDDAGKQKEDGPSCEQWVQTALQNDEVVCLLTTREPVAVSATLGTTDEEEDSAAFIPVIPLTVSHNGADVMGRTRVEISIGRTAALPLRCLAARCEKILAREGGNP